jgi:hypothetical protein
MDFRSIFAFSIIALFFSSLTLGSETSNNEFNIQSGLTGHWFNPERSGEGLVLEVLDDERILMYWFTYDEVGNQRWLLDVGIIEGASVTFETLTTATNGRFGPLMPNTGLQLNDVGTASIAFTDCNNAIFQFDAFGQQLEFPLQRLSQTMAAGCSPINGVLGEPVQRYAGETGSWFDPNDSGEGFTLQWLSRNQALVVWFTFDPDGNQFWMISVGERFGSNIVFQELLSARGARFGEAFDPSDVTLEDWGSLTFNLTCDEGSAQYESDRLEFGSGSIEVSRLTLLEGIGCPWAQPSIIDLYDLSLIWFDESQDNIAPVSINDDGIILARRQELGQVSEIVTAAVLSEGNPSWQGLPGFVSELPVALSRHGQMVLANDVIDANSDSWSPHFWAPELGWISLPSQNLTFSIADAASEDLSRVVGRGRNAVFGENDQPWIWSAESGQATLPLGGEFSAVRLVGVSNDGATAVAEALGAPADINSRRSVLWESGSEPRFLESNNGIGLGIPTKCNSDCSVITGLGFFESPSVELERRAWFTTKNSLFGLLEFNESVADSNKTIQVVPLDISSDGTLIVGSVTGLVDQQLANSGFIWTTSSGIEFAARLLNEVGLDFLSWSSLAVSSISPDGRLLLVSGREDGSFGEPTLFRTIVIGLE